MVLRAAVIGCGKIGSEFADDPRIEGIHSHAGAYAACPETQLVAVCDSDPVKLEQCGKRWQVAARYLDPRQMFAENKTDIVSICTPDATHYDLIRAAIQTHGVRAVLAEKPLALRLDHAREVVSLAKQRGIVLAVNYIRRYADTHIWLKEKLDAGEIGKLQTIGGYYSKGILHNGTHWIDLARFFAGEVVRVWGIDTRKESNDDPTLDVILEFESGVSGHLQGCDASAFSIFEMDLIGTRGRARLLDSGYVVEIDQVAPSAYFSGYLELKRKERIERGLGSVLLNAVQDLVNCVKENRTPRCAGEDGVAALKIALAGRASAQSGRPMILSRDGWQTAS